MENEWGYIIDFLYLALLFGAVAIIKSLIRPLKKLLLPNSVLAGFLGILFGPSVLGILNFSYDRLGVMVYHFMAIGFIAIALKSRKKNSTRTAVDTGFMIAVSYAIQGILGFSVALFIFFTFFKDVFMPFGLLLPLGFAQGPGQAYSMGTQWEVLGFTNGGIIGLAISTFGFLWAAFGGIILLNVLVFRKKAGPFKLEKPKVRRSVETTVKDYEFSDIDGMTIQMLTIGLVYFVTYMFLKWFTAFIGDFGAFGETFAQVLWGFHFVIGVMFAFIFRKLYDKYRSKKEKIEYVNNFLLQRAAGVVFDFMVAASIAAISFELISEYIVPIILLTTIGGFGTMIYSIWFCKRIYKNAVLEHIIAFFGMHTGTISTGMALLREVDPQFESGTAEDMVMGSGLALFLGLPLMLIINIPIMGFRLNQPIYYFYTMLALIAYFAIMYIFWFRKPRVDKG